MITKPDREQFLRGIASGAPATSPTDSDKAEVLRQAFAVVANKKDWKAPINCVIRLEKDDPIGIDLYLNAIEFMTATKAMAFFVNVDTVRIVSEGYRLGPAGS